MTASEISRLEAKLDKFIERTDAFLNEVRVLLAKQAEQHNQFRATLERHEQIVVEIQQHQRTVRSVAVIASVLGGIAASIVGAAATYLAK